MSSLVSDIRYAVSSHNFQGSQLLSWPSFHPFLLFPSTPIFLPILPRMSLYWDNSKPCPGFVRFPKQMKISRLSQENKFPFCLRLPLGVKECSENTLKSKILTSASCPLCASVMLSLVCERERERDTCGLGSHTQKCNEEVYLKKKLREEEIEESRHYPDSLRVCDL